MGRYDEADIQSKILIEAFKRVQGEEYSQTPGDMGGLAIAFRYLSKFGVTAAAAQTSTDSPNRVLESSIFERRPLLAFGTVYLDNKATTRKTKN